MNYLENGRSTVGEKLNNDIPVDIWKKGTDQQNKEKSLRDRAAMEKGIKLEK